MGLMRNAGALGLAKMLYDQARKPQNQARIKQALAQVQARRGGAGRR